MKVNRENLLATLEAVTPGVAKRESIEQSTCFVFKDGEVITFNDEVACRHPCDIGVTGAVGSAPLLTILGKLEEEEVDIRQGEGEILVMGHKRRAGIKMDAEIALATEGLEAPGKWHPLPEDFGTAVDIVQQCASSDTNKQLLMCVHIHPEYIEACDNFQLTRYPLATPVKRPQPIKRDNIRHVTGLKMQEISETKTWLHFRNPSGLVLSCRRFLEDYHDLSNVLELADTHTATLPKGLAEAVDKAQVFSVDDAVENLVQVDLRPDKLKLRGEGINGWYEERKQVKYDGPPISFKIGPRLLTEITRRHNEVELGTGANGYGKLRVNTGKFQYVACLIMPEANGEEE